MARAGTSPIALDFSRLALQSSTPPRPPRMASPEPPRMERMIQSVQKNEQQLRQQQLHQQQQLRYHQLQQQQQQQQHCNGLDIDSVLRYRNKKKLNVIEQQTRKNILSNGFCNLIGTAMVQNGYIISHRIPAYEQMNGPLVVGVVKLHITDTSKSLWICKKRTTGDGEEVSYDKLYSFFAMDCTKLAQQNGTGVCLKCVESKRSLICRLHNEVKLREGQLDSNLNDTRFMGSPRRMQN